MFGITWDWGTVAAIAAIIVIISDLVDKVWHLDGWQSQLRSGVLGMLVGLLGYLLGVGMFATDLLATTLGTSLPYWLGSLVVGLYAFVISSFAYMQPLMKIILEYLKIRPVEVPPQPTAKTTPK